MNEVRSARTSDGVRIAYSIVGPSRGPTVVLMPGVPFSNMAAEWRIPVVRRAFEELTTKIRLVQFDGRGTGQSQRDEADLSLDGMLRDLDAVLDAERIDQVVLLGFFASVTHAIAWAARHPRRIRGLILFGGSARGWHPMSGPGTQALLSLIEKDWNTFVESAAHAWLGWPDGEEGRMAADWFRTATTPQNALATLREAGAIDVTGDLSAVRCPVLVLHRADGTVVPIEISRELVESLPNARLEILAGSSASLFFETTDEVVRIISAFVADPAAPVAPVAGSAARPAALTDRELAVLGLLARGETNGQIADRLGITINTVERHVSNIYRKIEARGRADATAWAVRRGLA